MHTPKIYGTTTLNEKGQAVIPAEARVALGLSGGSKLIVMGAPGRNALILITAEEAEKAMRDMTQHLSAVMNVAKREESN
jgi:AbrB family looped-hinge helix DNA binding protein